MALRKKVRLTKQELKHQRDELERFQRFLPTLRLKKQSLQAEVRRVARELAAARDAYRRRMERVQRWVRLYADAYDVEPFVQVTGVEREWENVMGVSVPRLDAIHFINELPDVREAPAWADAGVEEARALIKERVGRDILRERHELLAAELRTTTQRVNLFEKVKIPEARENIRRIQIFLGDQQTAAVVRSKIAKTKNKQSRKGAMTSTGSEPGSEEDEEVTA